MLNIARALKPWKEAASLNAQINLYGFWDAEWHRCVVFGKLAEFAATLSKGEHVQVEGEIRTREYDRKKTGEKEAVTEIRVASILKLDRAEKASPEDDDNEESA